MITKDWSSDELTRDECRGLVMVMAWWLTKYTMPLLGLDEPDVYDYAYLKRCWMVMSKEWLREHPKWQTPSTEHYPLAEILKVPWDAVRDMPEWFDDWEEDDEDARTEGAGPRHESARDVLASERGGPAQSSRGVSKGPGREPGPLAP